MIKPDDWSSLITVNYSGGLIGDFFATLLDNNFTDDKHFVYDDRQRYSFASKDPFKGEMKCISTFYENGITPVCEDEFSKKVYFLYNKLFDNNPKNISKNIREYCYVNYSNSFYRTRVSSHHFVNFKNTSLQEIYPKSKNLFISTKNNQFLKISKLLFAYKTGIETFKIQDNGSVTFGGFKQINVGFDSFCDYFFNVDDIINRNNEFFIDIFELIYNNKSYNNELSQFLGTKIQLNMEDIEHYKNVSLYLLKTFNIDPHKTYSDIEFDQILKTALAEIFEYHYE